MTTTYQFFIVINEFLKVQKMEWIFGILQFKVLQKFWKKTNQTNAGVNESCSGNDCEESDELVGILFELEVDRGREHDGADQPSLDGAKPGPQNDGTNAVSGIVASLY